MIKGLRFKTGEIVACRLDDTEKTDVELLTDRFLTIHEPIQFVSFKFADPESGQIIETISMSPFFVISGASSFTVTTDTIMLISDLHASALSRYEQFLEQMSARLKDTSYEQASEEELYSMLDDDPEEDLFGDYDLDPKVLH